MISTSRQHRRLLRALAAATGRQLTGDDTRRLCEVPETDLRGLARTLVDCVPGRFSVTGSLERRILFAERPAGDGEWTAADLSGQPHATRAWPHWTHGRITIHDPSGWLSSATLTPDAPRRLGRPRILLAALYHPEWFPLPRFSLAISDLARAARMTLSGQVELVDMQLGATVEQIVTAARDGVPDIVGISATFGQHDLTIRVLDHLHGLPDPPVMIAGGSLTARNEALLLERYPKLLVARGAGEPTIADLIAYWHGDLPLDEVRGIGYTGSLRGAGTYGIALRKTPTQPNRAQTDFLPELDLLDQTFACKGVAQLETSRGCSSACSFCPRGHKGSWAGATPGQFPAILAALRSVFDRHPGIARVLYLVDEEFIGRDADAVGRARAIAGNLHDAGFAWESSCRIDQVVRLDQSRDWHTERARMWRELVRLGLRRMLFGVESGVTSVLMRFNKETTSEQNVLAIRTLSALGVPTRFTYITFDHLMSVSELAATCAFQARTDLLLRPVPELPVAEIVSGVRDPAFVMAHATGRPFYTGISYMLVSMECLAGAAYTRAVRAAGLTGAIRPSLGRVDADFADWRIGACSQHAQMWIDRNFALDYTLKSLEKVLDGRPRRLLHSARVVIKDAAFALLGAMLAVISRYPADNGHIGTFTSELRQILDDQLAELSLALSHVIPAALSALPDDAVPILLSEHDRWKSASGWQLINAADPCGT
jgi:hypothetical protein